MRTRLPDAPASVRLGWAAPTSTPSWKKHLRLSLPDLGALLSPALRGHLEHLRHLRDLGRSRAAGSFARAGGFLDIFEAKDLLEAEEIARSSPLVEGGLAAWTLREWIEIPEAP